MKTYLKHLEDSKLSPSAELHLLQYGEANRKPLTASEIYDAVFRSAFHPMFFTNQHWHILRFNEKFCRLFGYTHEEMQNMKRVQIFEVTEKPFLDFLDQRNDKGIAHAEITGIRKSGKRFPCRISSVVFTSDYDNERILNTLVDISDDLSARWNIGG